MPKVTRHHAQGLRRRLLRDVEQAHPHRRQLRLADRRDRGDGAGRRGQHPLQARARRGRGPGSAARAAKVAEFREKFANPYVAAARGFVDEVIQPRETRAQADRRARHARDQARPEPAEEARQHPAVTLIPSTSADRRRRHRQSAAAMKVLIANRGEIAVRVIRACREHGHRRPSPSTPTATAARGTCATPTRRWPHRRRAPPRESYLRIDAIIDAARRAGADAVHPGYGFLAENAAFARGVPRRGPDLHRPVARGDRADGQQDRGARRPRSAPACRSCPAPSEPLDAPSAATTRSRATAAAHRLSADGQGGGRRRRQGHARRRRAGATCSARCATARSEAGSAFGDARVYLERRIVAAAPHRDPAARRPARHRDPVRRARVLDPAAPPEGGRGIAVARGRRRRCAARSPARPRRSRARSATPTPARSSSCSTRTARSTSSR